MIEPYLTNPYTRQAFVYAGWFPGRAVSVARWKAECEQYGFIWSPMVDTVMGAVGGLTVTGPDVHPRVKAPAMEILFEPEADLYSQRMIAFYETFFHTSMCPLAIEDHGTGFLLTPDGRLYGLWMYYLLDYGLIADGALDTLMLGIRFPIVQAGTTWFQKESSTGVGMPKELAEMLDEGLDR